MLSHATIGLIKISQSQVVAPVINRTLYIRNTSEMMKKCPLLLYFHSCCCCGAYSILITSFIGLRSLSVNLSSTRPSVLWRMSAVQKVKLWSSAHFSAVERRLSSCLFVKLTYFPVLHFMPAGVSICVSSYL